jgi:hypothetical protein
VIRITALLVAPLLICLAVALTLGGCPATTNGNSNGGPTTPDTGTPVENNDQDGTPGSDNDTVADNGANDEPTDDTTGEDGEGAGDDANADDDGDAGDTDALPGVLQVKAFTDSLEEAAHIIPSGQDAPDDIDVNLTPIAYTIAFKRLVLKQVDEAGETVLSETELFSAETVADALTVDLLNAAATDLLNVESLPAGTYNQVDIEVFYLDMTIPTIYPASTSYDIPYRMVFEQMDLLAPRDFLLYLQPEWMAAGSDLASQVTEAGWYWMERGNPDHVVPVAGATEHPTFPVLDLFANDEFWSQEHKVLKGGRISPPLQYDPEKGGVVTINFDVARTFDFKDYHDETTPADGLWEIRRDAGIHPFPPNFTCIPEAVETANIAAD